MTRLIKVLPNMITLLRVVLSCLLNLYIIYNFGEIVVPTIMTLVIFLTDFLDGKIARFYGNTSRLGAVLDVSADLFYIVVTYVVLCYYDIIPFWFLLIVLLKFIEFVVTSFFLRKQCNEKNIFIFDVIGRITAVLFYVIPMLAYTSFHFYNPGYIATIQVFIYISTLMSLISSIYRIRITFCFLCKAEIQ